MKNLAYYSNSYLDGLRGQGDPLADALVLELLANPDWAASINSWRGFIPVGADLGTFSPNFQNFFAEYKEVPNQIDYQKVKLAQDFFGSQGNDYLSLLGLYSLPYCYAFADGAQVLVRSKRITEEVGQRLMETALFLLDAFKPGTFLQVNESLLTLAKVRLIHAFSRYFVKHYVKDWKSEWGVPINQEDMIGTNLAFSMLVIRGLDKLGKYPGLEVYEAVLYYWKLLGQYLGLAVEYWPETSKEAFELERLIRKRHLKRSEAGIQLINSLMRYYEQTFPEPAMTASLKRIIAFFVGKEASRALDLPYSDQVPGLAYRVLLDWSFASQRESNAPITYENTRKEFLRQSIIRMGKHPELSVPVIKRS
ncbi:MAG: oxygenase MpaB family protein [Mongoliitalea sp.]